MYHMDHFSLYKGQQQQHQDQWDLSPSSDDWFQWVQDSNDVSICPVIDNCKENSEISLNETQPFGDWLEYEFDEESKMDWEADFSMNSLLKEDSLDMKVPYESVGIYPETDCGSKPFDNISTDMAVNSQSISRDQSDLGSSKCMQHDFSQSMYWNKLDETSHFMLNTDQMEDTTVTKEPVVKFLIPSELKTSLRQDQHVDEETLFKATELQDLENVMTQLTPETRIFFRDALFRLANNSKQQSLQSQNRSGELNSNDPQVSNVHQETSMYGKRKLMELETNIIDRTIAELMFNELNCNATDGSRIESVDFSDESVTATSSFNSSFNQSPLLPCHYSNNYQKPCNFDLLKIEEK